MSRPDLQRKLLQQFVDMQWAARAASLNGGTTSQEFHNGRFTAFRDCVRELKKAIKEAK